VVEVVDQDGKINLVHLVVQEVVEMHLVEVEQLIQVVVVVEVDQQDVVLIMPDNLVPEDKV
jgi:hypothetical protein